MFILESIHDIRLMPVMSETRSGCTKIRSSQPRRLARDKDLRYVQVHASNKSYRYLFVEL